MPLPLQLITGVQDKHNKLQTDEPNTGIIKQVNGERYLFCVDIFASY